MQSSSIKKILILVTILAVPGFLYYLLQDQGKNRYKPLPVFGPKSLATTFHSVRGKQIPDTIYHQLDDFKLTNQRGENVTLSNWKGKVVVVELFYTGVQSEGAKTAVKTMQNFNALYQKNPMVDLVSISVNPLDAKGSELADYAQKIKAVVPKWTLLAADTTQIYPLVKKGLLLDVIKVDEEGVTKFIYSNKMVLLDTQHRIRGFYDIASHEEMSKLDDEIKVLIAEELRNIKDGR